MDDNKSSREAGVLVGRKILVVEDEYFLADDMARVLNEAGADVIGPVGDVTEALDVVDARYPIDLAILDINLRGMMVYPLAERLRERAIPFVFATGYAPAAVSPDYRDVPRWEKPFDAVNLVRMLPNLVRPS